MLNRTIRRRAGASLAMAGIIVLATASCHNNTGPKPTSMVFNLGDNQTAAAGSTLPIAPSVKIQDNQFNGVPSVRVIFSVTSGGGSSTGDTAFSDANGIATVGSWTLGATPGANTLSAASQGLQGSPLTFSATGN